MRCSVCFCLYFHRLSAFNYCFVVTLDVQNKYIRHPIEHFVLFARLISPQNMLGDLNKQNTYDLELITIH